MGRAGGYSSEVRERAVRMPLEHQAERDRDARVAEAFAADRSLLETSGCAMDVDLNQPGYIRASVRKGVEATKVGSLHRRARAARRCGSRHLTSLTKLPIFPVA